MALEKVLRLCEVVNSFLVPSEVLVDTSSIEIGVTKQEVQIVLDSRIGKPAARIGRSGDNEFNRRRIVFQCLPKHSEGCVGTPSAVVQFANAWILTNGGISSLGPQRVSGHGLRMKTDGLTQVLDR